MATRLLVLEDEDGLRASLRLLLESDGYEVVEAADAESALALVPGAGFDLMLVDLMLGGMDGFSFIRRARPMTEAPIVVISARDGVEDIVSALEAGADDYITKPFDVQEVRARLRAMLRRPVLSSDGPADGQATDGAVRGSDVFVLDQHDGPLVFDRGAAQLTRGPREIHLTMTEYRLLSVMAENSGRVLSRSSLLEHVWEEGFFGDERIVDVHVRRLRKKLERDPSAPRTLVTVRGLGYRLDTRVTVWPARRGLRASVTLAFALGALALSASLSLGTYFSARHLLVEQRERTALAPGVHRRRTRPRQPAHLRQRGQRCPGLDLAADGRGDLPPPQRHLVLLLARPARTGRHRCRGTDGGSRVRGTRLD